MKYLVKNIIAIAVTAFFVSACNSDAPKSVVVDEDPVGEIIPLAMADRAPLFPACKDAAKEPAYDCFQQELFAHIQRIYKYPDAARYGNVQGKVYVKFVVNKLGDIMDVEVVKGVDAHLDYEAKRIVKQFPRLKPAVHQDKNISVEVIIPVPFKLKEPES